MKATHWVLIFTAVALVGIDIHWASNRTPGDTISEVILMFAQKHLAIPFALGFLCGHLIWGQKIKPDVQ